MLLITPLTHVGTIHREKEVDEDELDIVGESINKYIKLSCILCVSV